MGRLLISKRYFQVVHGAPKYHRVLKNAWHSMSTSSFPGKTPQLQWFLDQESSPSQYVVEESVFTNLRIALQVVLTMTISVASWKRSISKLKLVLSYLRASMTVNDSGQIA